MAASVIAAVLERYDTFAITSTAVIYFDEAPARAAAGHVVEAPYVVLKDDGTTPDYDLHGNVIGETTLLRFEVYGDSLAQVDAISVGIRWNGGAVDAGLGMDHADSLTVTAQTFGGMFHEREQRFQETARGVNAGLIFRNTMRYRVQMFLRTG